MNMGVCHHAGACIHMCRHIFGAHDAVPGEGHPPHLHAALAELRVAAATLLAHGATRKGNDGLWTARPALMALTVACLRDPVLGVRAAAAARTPSTCLLYTSPSPRD